MHAIDSDTGRSPEFANGQKYRTMFKKLYWVSLSYFRCITGFEPVQTASKSIAAKPKQPSAAKRCTHYEIVAEFRTSNGRFDQRRKQTDRLLRSNCLEMLLLTEKPANFHREGILSSNRGVESVSLNRSDATDEDTKRVCS